MLSIVVFHSIEFRQILNRNFFGITYNLLFSILFNIINYINTIKRIEIVHNIFIILDYSNVLHSDKFAVTFTRFTVLTSFKTELFKHLKF